MKSAYRIQFAETALSERSSLEYISAFLSILKGYALELDGIRQCLKLRVDPSERSSSHSIYWPVGGIAVPVMAATTEAAFSPVVATSLHSGSSTSTDFRSI